MTENEEHKNHVFRTPVMVSIYQPSGAAIFLYFYFRADIGFPFEITAAGVMNFRCQILQDPEKPVAWDILKTA